MASIRSSLRLVFLAILFIVLAQNGSDARAKNSMKLRIPYVQRGNCLAKLLCGIQSQSSSSSYTNQAHLLRKYFQTYQLPELDDVPLKSKSDEDEDDLDDSASGSDESDDSTDEEVKKPVATTAKPGKVKKQDKSKPKQGKQDKKPSKPSLFDTGVPIIERPTLSPAVAIQQNKGKRHWTPIHQELTVREARQLATKNSKNCDAIQGCGFSFRQIFLSLQENSNVIGSEAISALSSANFEGPIAEDQEEQKQKEQQQVKKRVTATQASIPSISELFDDMEPISELHVATSPMTLPAITINENEDDLESPDIRLPPGGVEDLFLATHLNEKEPIVTTSKKTRRPVTANTKKEKKKPTTTTQRPEVVPYEYQIVTHSRSKGSRPKPQRLNYKTPSSTGSKLKISKKNRTPSTTTTEPSTTTTFPSTQIPVFQAQAGTTKKRPTGRPLKKRPYDQTEENYDDSRDTYDEEEAWESPDADDYGEDLEDVTLEDEDNGEDDEDDEVQEYGGGGGWGQGGGEKKKQKPPKKKKIKNKKKKNKKKKNKGKKKKKGQQQQQQHGGWGWPTPQKRPHLTEIGGRPLSPTPEPHPLSGFLSGNSGWATLYRRGQPETAGAKEPETHAQQQMQRPSQLLQSSLQRLQAFGFGSGSSGSSSSSVSNSTSTVAEGRKEVEPKEDHLEYQYKPATQGHQVQASSHQGTQGYSADQTPMERVSGFSLTKLMSPFTSLYKVVNTNMRGG